MQQKPVEGKDGIMTAATLRKTVRWFHIIGGLILGTYIYAPWGSDPLFAAITQFVVTPALVVSGIFMWKQAAITRLFRGAS